jgi:nucleotide-binding universal stress UspA family protein
MEAQSRVMVVGVDGSEGGRRALEWAVHEAAARGGLVQAVAVWRWDLPSGGLDVDSGTEDPQQRAEQLLAREIAALPPGMPVASQVLEGRPAEALGTAARTADLLVLGSHGHSRVWHTVLGSVAEECVRTATCAVVVIPVPAERPAKSGTPAVPG